MILLVGAVSTGEFSARAADSSTGFFNVKDYGAKGDGKTLDTGAFNKAIEAIAAAGGGTVFLPAGTYLTGTIHLKSKVVLQLDAGATILGSKNLADYSRSSTAPMSDAAPLIEGTNLHDVGIIGNGAIDGNTVRNPNGRGERRGPHAVYLTNVREFVLRDFTLKDSSNYAFLIIGCEHGTISGLKVYGGYDGIHMRNTRDVTISNSRIYSGDDSLAGVSWMNVVVTNTILSSAAHPMRLSGENVVFSDILIVGPSPYPHPPSDKYNVMSAIVHMGAPVMGRGGAPLPPVTDELLRPRASDNMVFNGITMNNVRSPMYMASTGCCRYPEGVLSAGLKKIFVNNMTVIGAGKLPLAVVGAPVQSRVESVVLNNVRLIYDGGIEQADGYSLDPSSGFYFENVDRVELNNVRVEYREKDARPVIMAKDVGKLILNHVVAPTPDTFPLYVIDKVGEVLVDDQPAPISTGQIQALDLDLHRTAGHAVVSEPFNAVVTVQNTGGDGFTEVKLRFGQQNLAKSVWLKAKERRQVLFADLKAAQPGEYRIEAGKFQKTVNAEAVAPQQPVSAPYVTFSNVNGEMFRRGDTINVLAPQGEYYLNQFLGKDSYASVYLKAALHQDAAITVRVDKPNPDMQRSNGMVGIMVKNDISKAGQSAGYATVESSIQWGVDREWSNGYAMEWDADGDGRTDHHTPFDGYTQWPHWLKLERHGAKYTGFYSLDGEKWTRITEVEAPGGSEAEDVGVFATEAGGRFQDLKVVDLPKP